MKKEYPEFYNIPISNSIKDRGNRNQIVKEDNIGFSDIYGEEKEKL